MNVQQQNPDGSWSGATPVGPQGIMAKIEFYLRGKGYKTISNLFAKWDERTLGR